MTASGDASLRLIAGGRCRHSARRSSSYGKIDPACRRPWHTVDGKSTMACPTGGAAAS